MNDRDRDAADDWMQEHMPDPDQLSLEDNDERGCEERFYFLRGRDGAMVVYRIRVKGGRVVSVRDEVFIDEDAFEGHPQEERWIARPESGKGRANPPWLRSQRISGRGVLPRRASPSDVS